MPFKIISIPIGDSLAIAVNIRTDEWGGPLTSLDGRAFSFLAKSDLSLPDSAAEISASLGSGITVIAKQVRVLIASASFNDLASNITLYWAIKSCLTDGGIVRTLAQGLLTRSSSAGGIFAAASIVQIVAEDNTVITTEDGSAIAQG